MSKKADKKTSVGKNGTKGTQEAAEDFKTNGLDVYVRKDITVCDPMDHDDDVAGTHCGLYYVKYSNEEDGEQTIEHMTYADLIKLKTRLDTLITAIEYVVCCA